MRSKLFLSFHSSKLSTPVNLLTSDDKLTRTVLCCFGGTDLASYPKYSFEFVDHRSDAEGRLN